MARSRVLLTVAPPARSISRLQRPRRAIGVLYQQFDRIRTPELILTHVAIWGGFETRPYNYFGVRRKKVCPVTYLVASESR